MPGHCDARFSPVADAFAQNFRDGLEVGAACAVVIDGQSVVDIWDGVKSRTGTATSSISTRRYGGTGRRFGPILSCATPSATVRAYRSSTTTCRQARWSTGK